MTDTDKDWRKKAACRGLVGPDFDWFPARGRYITARVGSNPSGEIQTLLDICNSCSVKNPCLEFALQFNEPGIWGGTSSRQRRAINKERAKGIEIDG